VSLGVSSKFHDARARVLVIASISGDAVIRNVETFEKKRKMSSKSKNNGFADRCIAHWDKLG